jgi:hypothetical protein
MAACHGRGREFESRRPRHIFQLLATLSRAETVGSVGMRLLVSVEELQRVLNETGFDLIAEVEVTRKKVGREYERPIRLAWSSG